MTNQAANPTPWAHLDLDRRCGIPTTTADVERGGTEAALAASIDEELAESAYAE
ncbi:hypothetical protein RCH16_000997 [Cryobacterium sp. MP_M5]|uniref:hypothetical protein n=1 Tax=unclassified Cryobacterium TaxID=2649013 RepID=UPI0018CB65E0|nr:MULTISPECIES: hypothetical protein [unclassified Cryobacterium]MBG6057799.1 hypothetical protein [Cryobacterium sp. MP_M3]MEC5175998.1 hypothetical protein [Cryobacterium sp. MP_M5]